MRHVLTHMQLSPASLALSRCQSLALPLSRAAPPSEQTGVDRLPCLSRAYWPAHTI